MITKKGKKIPGEANFSGRNLIRRINSRSVVIYTGHFIKWTKL